MFPPACAPLCRPALTLAKKEAKRWESVWVFLALNCASFSAPIRRRHLSRRYSRRPLLPSGPATSTATIPNPKPTQHSYARGPPPHSHFFASALPTPFTLKSLKILRELTAGNRHADTLKP